MKSIVVIVVLLAMSWGCKKADPVAPSPGPSANEPAPAKEPAPQATTQASEVPGPKKEVLERVFREVWCLHKRADRSGLQAIFDGAGFKDAAAWATAWDQAKSADPSWAEKTMAVAVNKPCSPTAAASPLPATDGEPVPDGKTKN